MNNIALNVVIGLVFIYLLYSLLATIVSEIIATAIGLRARNLKEAVDRMLNDDLEPVWQGKWNNRFLYGLWDFIKRFFDSIYLLKDPSNPIVNKFYNNPEIKYLSSTGLFKNPSSFKAASFSRTLLYELNGSGELNKDNIRTELETLAQKATINEKNPNTPNKGVSDNKVRTLDLQAAQYVLSLYYDSHGDLIKFRSLLENWFDRTMEQALEWYKRKIQVILLILGFLMAWCFNADTFVIVHKLSTDNKAREEMVKLASAYVTSNNNLSLPSSADSAETQQKLNQLLEAKKQLDADIVKANTLLGSGAWLPDTITVKTDTRGKRAYSPSLQEHLLLKIDTVKYIKANSIKAIKVALNSKLIDNGKIILNHCNKWTYFFGLFVPHFFGYLITALAISMGAPFWFDLLNKVMKLRTSVKQETGDGHAPATSNMVPQDKRVG